ncbi:MAG: type II secretion system protein J [Phycisphaerae bacterium]
MRHRQTAFTVAELVVSMTVMTLVMGGLTSALVLSVHALPDNQQSSQTLVRTADTLDHLAGELLCAQTVSQQTSSSITFTVADRDGDTVPETIQYAWSGIPGTPLTRSYNAGAGLAVIDNVQNFDLAYDLIGQSTIAPDPTESAETLLFSQDAVAGPADFAITNNNCVGQCFTPTLPADAIEWKVTRVLFQARSVGLAKGITAVQLRTPAAGVLPGTAVLEEQFMNESSLSPFYAWKEFFFNAASGLSPADGICLVLAKQFNDVVLAEIQYESNAGAGLVTSTTGGASWTMSPSQSMILYVYGTITAPGTPQTPTLANLTGVRVSIDAGVDPTVSLQTAVRILNEPEVTLP